MDAAQKEILAAMEAWKQATLGKNGPALQGMLHDDLTYCHSNGRTQTKTDVLDDVIGGKSSVVGIELGDQNVRVYGTTALVKGPVDMLQKSGATVPLDILHVWLKGPQGWQMVGRQATKRG